MSIILPNENERRSRLDDILYALCTLSLLDEYDVPNEDRINEYYKALLTGDLSELTFMPKSRIEKLLHFLTIGTNEGVEAPKTRVEYLLYVLAGLMQVSALPFNVDERSSRHEKYLMYLIENGGVGVKSLTVSFFNNQEILNSKEGSVENLTFKGNTILPVIKENLLSEEVDTANVECSDSEYEGEFKSAILKGCTLVNVIHSKREANSMCTDYNLSFIDKTKTYFIKFNSSYIINQIGILADYGSWNVVNRNVTLTNGYITLKPDESSEVFGLRIRYDGQIDDGSIPTIDVICVEYQEGMENWDIPYFTGMQSVEMPVLKTTGKNLFDGELISGYYEDGSLSKIIGNTSELYKTIRLNLKKGTYTFSFEESVRFVRQLKDGVYNTFGGDFTKFTTTLQTDGTYILSFRKTDNSDFDLTKIQIEQGSTATSYEPYKSNILTTNEEVELRGIGEVQDELNLLTGELTQRFEEVVLDGSEDWIQGGTQSSGFVRFYAPPTIKKAQVSKMISPNFPCYNGNVSHGIVGTENVTGVSYNIYLNVNVRMERIGVTDLTNSKQNIELFKQWLSNNPITVQYELETPVVKTVDLNIVDHNDNTLEKMSTFKDGHIILSSEEGALIPSLTYSVARNDAFELTNLKSNNTYTVQTNEKEFTLNGVTYPEIETSATTTASVDRVISIDDVYTRVDNVEKMVLEGMNYGNLLQESVPSRISTLTIVDDNGIRESTLIFNEEIILRSNNTTKDTLDLLTGQLIRYFDTNGNLLETPTTEIVTYTVYNNGASDDVLALIPDGNIIFDSAICPRLSYKFDVIRERLFSYDTISSKELYTEDENFAIVYGDHRGEKLPQLDEMTSCINPSIAFSDGSNSNTHKIEGTFRSIGTKFDEVDVINNTATINFGAFTLDGTENWAFLGNNTNTTGAYVRDYLADAPTTTNVLSTCSIGCGNASDSLSDEEGVYLNGLNRYVYVRINNDKLQSQDVAGIVAYLNENPIEVIYQLAHPVTMNINITSDGAMVSYEDVTYVSLTSDSGVLPHETTVQVAVKTKDVVEEVSTLSLRQNETEEQIEEQSDKNLVSMVATTEIYENLL